MSDMINVLRKRKGHYMDPEQFRVFLITLIIFCVIYGVMHKFFPNMDKKKRDMILFGVGAALIVIGTFISHG